MAARSSESKTWRAVRAFAGERAAACVWTSAIDGDWTVAVNGTRIPRRVIPEGGTMAVTMPPNAVAVWFRGWLAGLFVKTHGTIANIPGASEDALIKSLRAAAESGRL